MLTSTVATRRTIDFSFDDDSESSVHVVVHDSNPPFLDGRAGYPPFEPIDHVRNPTRGMAVSSPKGNAPVKDKCEQAERAKAAAKLTAPGDTAIGNVMGVQDEETKADGESSFLLPHWPIGVDIAVVFFVLPCNMQQRRRCRQRMVRRTTTRAIQNPQHIEGHYGSEWLCTDSYIKCTARVLACREKLMKVIPESQRMLISVSYVESSTNRLCAVVMVIGEIGSGETTQLAQFLCEDGCCTYRSA